MHHHPAEWAVPLLCDHQWRRLSGFLGRVQWRPRDVLEWSCEKNVDAGHAE